MNLHADFPQFDSASAHGKELHTDYPQFATTSTRDKEPQGTIFTRALRSILSILAYQYTNTSGVSVDNIQTNWREEESLPPARNERSTWTYARQQRLVSHELARRRHSLQCDDNAFRKVKAELRRSGTVTGWGAVQLLDQKVVATLSEQRLEQASNTQQQAPWSRRASAA